MKRGRLYTPFAVDCRKARGQTDVRKNPRVSVDREMQRNREKNVGKKGSVSACNQYVGTAVYLLVELGFISRPSTGLVTDGISKPCA